MKNKNVWIVIGAVALIAAVAVLAMLVQLADIDMNGPVLATAQPGEAKAYLVVTAQGVTYQPIPLTEDAVYNLNQAEGVTNVVRVTPDSFWMESSTCDNQDCVEQGVVSLDTMDQRVLGNLIICLPHQLTLEMYTAEEVEALLANDQP